MVLGAEAEKAGVLVSVVEQLEGPVPGTFRSVLLELDDDGDGLVAQAFSRRWCGSLLWVCESPYRKLVKRKNWFLHGAAFAPPQAPGESGEIRYEATRASGPGGQHVNKTDSAIRATHVASGLTVKVQSQRSQHANKKLAAQLLASKLAKLMAQANETNRSARHWQHHSAERGNAVRSFEGTGFIER